MWLGGEPIFCGASHSPSISDRMRINIILVDQIGGLFQRSGDASHEFKPGIQSSSDLFIGCEDPSCHL